MGTRCETVTSGQTDDSEDRRKHHDRPGPAQYVVEPHERHDAEESHEDDEPGPDEEESAGRVDVCDPFEARLSGLRYQQLDATGAHRDGACYETRNRGNGAHSSDHGKARWLDHRFVRSALDLSIPPSLVTVNHS